MSIQTNNPRTPYSPIITTQTDRNKPTSVEVQPTTKSVAKPVSFDERVKIVEAEIAKSNGRYELIKAENPRIYVKDTTTGQTYMADVSSPDAYGMNVALIGAVGLAVVVLGSLIFQGCSGGGSGGSEPEKKIDEELLHFAGELPEEYYKHGSDWKREVQVGNEWADSDPIANGTYGIYAHGWDMVSYAYFDLQSGTIYHKDGASHTTLQEYAPPQPGEDPSTYISKLLYIQNIAKEIMAEQVISYLQEVIDLLESTREDGIAG